MYLTFRLNFASIAPIISPGTIRVIISISRIRGGKKTVLHATRVKKKEEDAGPMAHTRELKGRDSLFFKETTHMALVSEEH